MLLQLLNMSHLMLNHQQSRAVRMADSSAVSALVFLVWDLLITFDDEVECIWSKPNKCWIKWQFLFARYFALAAQISNRYIEMSVVSDVPFMIHTLRVWYTCQAMVGHILMTAVEIILMARVYALYNKNRWIAFGFIVLILAENITMIIGVVLTLPGHKIGVKVIITTSPSSFTYLGITGLVSQVTILILTLIKYSFAVRSGWGRTPIVMLMIRDGTLAFVALFVLSMVTVVYTVLGSSMAGVGYAWLLSIVSSAGCRLIINMQRLPVPSSPTMGHEFTTVTSEFCQSSV